MVRIMATENQAILIETVQAVKNYLDAELAKYESWEEAKKSHLMNLLDGSRQEDFERLKTKGVGQTTILKFLGKGWKQWKIQHALEVINSAEIAFGEYYKGLEDEKGENQYTASSTDLTTQKQQAAEEIGKGWKQCRRLLMQLV